MVSLYTEIIKIGMEVSLFQGVGIEEGVLISGGDKTQEGWSLFQGVSKVPVIKEEDTRSLKHLAMACES